MPATASTSSTPAVSPPARPRSACVACRRRTRWCCSTAAAWPTTASRPVACPTPSSTSTRCRWSQWSASKCSRTAPRPSTAPMRWLAWSTSSPGRTSKAPRSVAASAAPTRAACTSRT
ncbi:hypothetical protein G6F61_014888 [Rhizopus arrhizus]|nr:hypothetical protein G6F61_014888 [Rhizopus arrhizus]